MAVYMILSCYPYEVNYCLGMRFLLERSEEKKMKREAEKKKARDVSNSKSAKITLSADDLVKKPIGVRKKSTKSKCKICICK